MIPVEDDIQTAFLSLVNGENCYCWRATVARDASGATRWSAPSFELDAAQRFLPLDASTIEEYVARERERSDSDDRALCNARAEEALRDGPADLQQEYRIHDETGRLRTTRELLHFEARPDGTTLVLGLCFDVTETRVRERFQAGQSAVLERIAAGESASETLAALCRLIESAVGEGFVAVGRFDVLANHIREIVAPSFPPRHREFIEKVRFGLPEVVKMTREPLIVSDVRLDDDWKPYRFLFRASGCPAAWTYPVRNFSGETSGFLAICLRIARTPSPVERQVIEAASQIVGVALEREDAERRREASEKTVSDVLRGARCLLWHATVERVVGEYVWSDYQLPQKEVGLTFLDLGAGDSATFFERLKEATNPEDRAGLLSRQSACFEGNRAGYQNEFRCVDLLGRVTWIREDVRVEPLDEGRWRLVGVSTDVTAQRRAEEDVRWQAVHDSLTGLPNRILFHRYLDDAIARCTIAEGSCAVLFIDLDRFKQVNDKLGHALGDQVLVTVAARLRDAVRGTDVVARISGDEFTALLPDVSSRKDVEAVAGRVRAALHEPFLLDGVPAFVGGSIGCAVFPEHGETGAALLRAADLAMYRAKQGRDGAVRYFTEDLNQHSERLTVETELRRATERGEFFLEYQPQIDTCTSELLTVEALIRWNHPERGLVQPSDFIHIAEESGAILLLGQWVLQEACAQAALWQRSGLPLRVSVNLSARQFSGTELVEHVRQVLARTGLDAARLDLEITETAILQQGGAARETLLGLRELGVRLMIDDFGTGYSSLASLRSQPIDVVKIDRSFVMGMMESAEDAAIVRAVVDLAQALGLEVVAEGVETDEHRVALEALGCTLMQGFFFSRPVPASAVPALLRFLPDLRKAA